MKAHALFALAALAATGGGGTLVYRFVEVKHKVVVRHGDAEHRAAVDESAAPGDGVSTGWWGWAVIAVPDRAARFEILPSTRATLAGPEPGVLVTLERGRLKAFFDALTGNEERLVATPGALLAVRGTRYGVEVEKDGTAAVAVFAGTVEVRPRDPAFAMVAVRAGEVCRFGPRTAPHAAPMPRGMGEETWRGGMAREPAAGGQQPGSPGMAPGSMGPQDPNRRPSNPKGGGGHG